jgi:lipid IVA palmitoyltransferase
MLISRQDIWGGAPFPALLPLVALRYDRFTLLSTYIPTLGGVNHGSVVYVFGKLDID